MITSCELCKRHIKECGRLLKARFGGFKVHGYSMMICRKCREYRKFKAISKRVAPINILSIKKDMIVYKAESGSVEYGKILNKDRWGVDVI